MPATSRRASRNSNRATPCCANRAHGGASASSVMCRWKRLKAPRVLTRFENGTPLMLEQKLGAGQAAGVRVTAGSPVGMTSPSIRCLCASWPRPRRISPTRAAMLQRRRSALPPMPRRCVAVAARCSIRRASAPRCWAGCPAASAQWIPQLAGFYELRASGRSEYIAVNVDPRESRLARWDEDARKRWLDLQNLDRTAATPPRRPRRPESGCFRYGSGCCSVQPFLPSWNRCWRTTI